MPPAPLPVDSQPQPVLSSKPAQHTPPAGPASMQPKPSGQFFVSRSHGIVHAMFVPSFAHDPATQSAFVVQAAPRPPGASGPAMHAPLKQM